MNRDQLWPEGEYDGVPESATYEVANTGSECVAVTFDLTGHKRKINLWFHNPTADAAKNATNLARTIEKCAALGFKGDFPDKLTDPSPNPVKLTLKHAEYKGSWKEEWTYWGPKAEANLPADRAALYRAKYKQATQSVPKPAGRPATPPTATPAPSPTQTPPKSATSAPPIQRPARPTVTKPDEPAANANAIVANNADEAWDYFATNTPTMAEADREIRWSESVKQFGVPESQLTPAQWNKVAHGADIPF